MRVIEKRNKKKKKRLEKVIKISFIGILLLFFFLINSFASKAYLRTSKYGDIGPIDVVYTFVNGSDEVWIKQRQELLQSLSENEISDALSYQYNKTNRFRTSNELLYSIRSVEKHAPWVNNIFIVVATESQVPYWLDISHSNIKVITHNMIFKGNNKDHLPTFNSAAIESHLDEIPGLSEYFLYFNDDVFLGLPIEPTDFIEDFKQKIHLAWLGPTCAEFCAETDIGNGVCNLPCNVSSCSFDKDDCSGDNIVLEEPEDTFYSFEKTQQSDCEKAGCYLSWLNDNLCDTVCNIPVCGYDAGDCASLKNLSSSVITYSPNFDSTYFVKKLNISSDYLEMENTNVETYNSSVLVSHIIVEDEVVYVFFLLNITFKPDLFTFKVSHFGKNETSIKLNVGFQENATWFKTNEYSLSDAVPPDSFSLSIKQTSKVFREAFTNYQPLTRVIAHMPHFMQKSKLQQMKILLQKPFEKTSSNHFRSSNDMQFALSYFNFLAATSESSVYLSTIFNHFDTSKDGELNFNELKTLYLVVHPYETLGSLTLPENKQKVVDFRNEILSNTYYGQFILSQGQDFDLISEISELSSTNTAVTLSHFSTTEFESTYTPQLINHFKEFKNLDYIIEPDFVTFVMLRNGDIDNEITRFDEMRQNPPKFFCINDDVDESKQTLEYNAVENLFKEVEEFYKFLFPIPSSFEIQRKSSNVHVPKSMSDLRNIVGFCLVATLFISFILASNRSRHAKIS